MKTKDICKGIFVMMAFVLMVESASAATIPTTTDIDTTSASSTTSVNPTNMVLDYDLTHIDSNLKPGDSGILQIVIKNTGSQPAENVQVFVPETGGISANKRWDIGRVNPLESKTMSTAVTVSKDTYIGLHTLQVRISYDGYDSEQEREDNQLSVWEFPVRVVGSANFQINVIGNETFLKDVAGNVAISGTTKDGARDVSATISSSCASVVGSPKEYLGSIDKNSEFNLEYTIKPTEVGTCTLNLLMNYSDASGNPMQETLSLGIDVQRYDVDFKVLDVSYANVTPGTTSVITITLENVGGDSARDLAVDMGFTNPFTAVGSSEKYVREVKSRETITLSFESLIDATADIKAYSIPLTLDYFDSAGTENTVTKSVGVEVSGNPDIKIILERADFFAPGTKGTVTVNVINKGFAQVQFLDLVLLPTENYDVTSSSEAYIGNLDSDSTDSQDFQIQVKNIAPGKIPLKFQISYKESNSNIDQVEPVDLELVVLSMQDYASNQPTGSLVSLLFTVVGAVIGIIVLFVGLWLIYKIVTSAISFLDRKFFKKKA